ncbi:MULTISPECIES: sugar phosphate nucleotidyltransferase [Sphingomonas]|uniref:phosphocholine cytidylyltransferase family protein n=1 Tax=Sphingomonas TaxID=13687 RepID=UPI000F7E206D|nr:phosphocholine cytidylyltransferase family protein [Sphingomonas sp. ABOLF]RSV15760.1 phosphocholine cytidylyltransferase family protein [Sphingomonas sp. ABOLF]GLK21195.1 nucleotidyltransferase [Microbacterium terregens]
MKAVILSAGYGSRLLPLTMEIPKCLVKVQGREILLQQLTALAEAGIEEAAVVVGYRHRQVRQFVAERALPLRVSTVFNPFWSVSNSIGSVWVARAHLLEPFCLLNGDTVFEQAVLSEALRQPPPGIGLVVEPIRGPVLDDMRVAVADDRVTAVAKDLDSARTTHRSLGVITSTGEDGAYARALETVIERDSGHAAYHHAIVAELAATVGVTAIEHQAGKWQEIDRPEDIDTWGTAQGTPA